MTTQATPAIEENRTAAPEAATEPEQKAAPNAAATDHSAHDEIETALKDVVGLGRMWARYGLDVGSRALQASSTSLAVTSKALQQLSDSLATR